MTNGNVKKDPLYVVLSTISEDDAKPLADELVMAQVAACVNIARGLESIYVWKEEVCDDREALLIIKTRKSKLAECMDKINKLHPYEVPEIAAFPAEHTHPPYYNWLVEQTP